jgi:hypothetical protein
VHHQRPRREKLGRVQRVVADSEGVRGVEADAEGLVAHALDELEQLGGAEVAVVLERELQAELARPRRRGS